MTGIVLKYRTNYMGDTPEEIARNTAEFNLYRRYQQAHLPAELHFITDASHGQGLMYNGRQWNEWIDLLFAFMKAIKMVE